MRENVRFTMEGTERASFRIGHEPSTHIVITHACKPGVKVENYGPDADHAWHAFRVQAAVPGFHADLAFETHLVDFSNFRDELEAMSRTLTGTAAIESIESDLKLSALIDKMGHVAWEGTLRRIDPRMNVNELTFSFQNDQSYLRELVLEMDSLLNEARGEPTNSELQP